MTLTDATARDQFSCECLICASQGVNAYGDRCFDCEIQDDGRLMVRAIGQTLARGAPIEQKSMRVEKLPEHLRAERLPGYKRRHGRVPKLSILLAIMNLGFLLGAVARGAVVSMIISGLAVAAMATIIVGAWLDAEQERSPRFDVEVAPDEEQVQLRLVRYEPVGDHWQREIVEQKLLGGEQLSEALELAVEYRARAERQTLLELAAVREVGGVDELDTDELRVVLAGQQVPGVIPAVEEARQTAELVAEQLRRR